MRATAWLSLLAWTAANLDARPRAARWWSALGLLALLAHSALAFELRYAWSHALAARETASQSQALLGFSTGLEIFANYLFLVVWGADVGWAWLSPRGYSARPRLWRDAVRGLFLLMFVSGAIVFVRGPLRFLGAAAVLAVVAAWYRGREASLHHDV